MAYISGPFLLYAEFDSELVRTDGSKYYEQNQWLEDHIDTTYLLDRYDADNIVFLFFFNTDYSNDVNPWSLGHRNGDYIKLEFSNIYMKFDNYDAAAGTYAHELMHAFGAPDMYYANDCIPQEYVDHLKDIGSNEIMYTVSLSNGITNDFTDLDAYYVGIGPRPEEADQWSLGISEHD